MGIEESLRIAAVCSHPNVALFTMKAPHGGPYRVCREFSAAVSKAAPAAVIILLERLAYHAG